MTIPQLVTIGIVLFAAGVVLLAIGIKACNQPKQTPGFSIDPQLLRTGRHLPTSRAQEAEFINRA